MKKIILSAAILLGCMTFKADAQVQVSLGVNIGSQPDWGPVGYDHADYYYMPDIDTYYDVPSHQYVYLENNVWVRRTVLPVRYRNYDVYKGYKVVINERNPWERNRAIKAKYATYRNRHDQVIIRNSRDVRYRDHWKGNNGGGPGHGNGHYVGHGNAPGHGNGPGHSPAHNNDHGKGPGHGKGHDKH